MLRTAHRPTNRSNVWLSALTLILVPAIATVLLSWLVELPGSVQAIPSAKLVTQAGVLHLPNDANADAPLTVQGMGFAPSESVQFYLQPQAKTQFSQLVPMARTQADATGTLALTLPPHFAPVVPQPLFIIARGEATGFTQPVGPVRAPALAPTAAPPTPAPTLAPTLVPTSLPPTPIPLDTDPQGRWYGQYFANRDLEDGPVLKRNDVDLNFNFGRGSPAAELPTDGFSVRWEGRFLFDRTDNYKFSLTIDDGARVYYDGQLILDEWHVGGRRTASANVPVLKGEHRLRVDYYEDSGAAQIGLTWKPSYSAWQGRYYNSTDLTGPVVVRCDDGEVNGALVKDWGDGGPGFGVSNDNFSADWLSTVVFDKTGDYTFRLLGDDGMRVFIDGAKVYDNWGGTVQTEFNRRITRGSHRIQIQYVERSGAAAVHFDWLYIPPPQPQPTAVPASS